MRFLAFAGKSMPDSPVCRYWICCDYGLYL